MCFFVFLAVVIKYGPPIIGDQTLFFKNTSSILKSRPFPSNSLIALNARSFSEKEATWILNLKNFSVDEDGSDHGLA